MAIKQYNRSISLFGMRNLIFTCFSFLFLGWSTPLLSQTFDISKIIRLRSEVQKTTDLTQRIIKNDSLRNELISFIKSENSYNRKLEDIKYIGDLKSPDDAFRMITWNINLNDGTYKYFCFIQTKPDKSGQSSWYELQDHHKTTNRPEYKTLNTEKWYGCLYYEIIPFKNNKTTMYVLLGWEGNDKFSNKKVLESLYFNNKNEPNFGKSVFETDRMNKRRVIFEYSKDAYMMLRYNEKAKQIIFNRLEPMNPDLVGIYSYYMPTLTYDAYELHKGNWIIVQDINPRNEKSNREYHAPPKTKPKKN